MFAPSINSRLQANRFSVRFRLVWLSRILMAALLLPASYAAPIAIGVISFDVAVPPSGADAGVNVIQIQNLTGSASLLPDFPVLTDLTFSSLTLTLTTSGGLQVIDLGVLGPGSLPTNPALQFASTFAIQSLTLTAILSPSTGLAIDGSAGPLAMTDPNLLYVLLPSAGDELVAGIDFGVLETNLLPTQDPNPIPEPATFTLVGTAIAGLFFRSEFCKGRRLKE
jgi:hypothetical protein